MLMNLSFSPDEISAQQIQAFFPQLNGKLDLKRHFMPVAKNLEQVEERLQFLSREFDPGIAGYVEYTTKSQGKRIRPALSLLMAHTTSEPTNHHHLNLAVVVELI